MKKIIFSYSLFFVAFNLFSQNTQGKSDDSGRIILNSFVPDQIENVPASAQKMLLNKLDQVVTASGLGGSQLNPRFIITPNITVLTKDITPTAPPMTAMTLEVTLYIGDGIDGVKFASESLILKGVGKSETKAYIAALNGIKPKNPDLLNLITSGKNKIMEYYNSKCDFIIKDAESKAQRKEFDEAISVLVAIPEVCKECYDKSQETSVTIFKLKMENECAENIQLAKAAKANNQMEEAANLLSGILPGVSCFNEAASLIKEIEDKLIKDENKNWAFKLRAYQDGVDINKAAIKAARDIGVAYGKNQPKTVYNIRGWF